MFDRFSHFIAYGSTDQETLRELTGSYDGLIVPGTVAAYQAEGTRGFVLTLSASAGHPYAIDPRTPLFQYHNGSPKLSHGSLARVLGIEPEVTQYGMVPPQLWTQQYCNKVAKSWIDFNSNYTSIAPKQFDKYARRLGMKLPIADAKLPTWILAPYLMHTDYFDPTEINQRLWVASKLHLDPKDDRLRRVIAASTAADLKSNALGSDEEEIVVWLDDLDEFEPSNFSRLAEYGKAIKEISESGIKPFALYGGFFSVALSTVGLTGSSHGVGFSEHRYHVDLKSSGGAPARFYVQRIHRYLPIDIASELWRQNRQLVAAYYPGYPNRDPGEYSYHELMKHSVRARSDEIHRSSHATPESIADDLESTYRSYLDELSSVTMSRPAMRRVQASIEHLPAWSSALRELL